MSDTNSRPDHKRKTVYFNLNDQDELHLYEQIKDVKNFSSYVKSMIYTNLVKNSNQEQN